MARVTYWLSEHLIETAWLTLDDVAVSAGVSPASVVRACQLLGYEGYSHFQRTVRDGLPGSDLVNKLTRLANETDSAKGKRRSPVDRVLTAERENLERLAPLIGETLGKVADVLLHASRIGVVSALSSATLGQSLAAHLAFVLDNVSFFESGSAAGWMFYRDLGPEDVVLALCFPRYAKATLDMVRQVRGKTPHVVLITDPVGPHGPKTQLRLRVPISGDLFSAGPPMAVVTQMLVHELLDRDANRILMHLKMTEEALAQAGILQQGPSPTMTGSSLFRVVRGGR
jgi:DNA-binding MurR/RpiR family transcriptional regulator